MSGTRRLFARIPLSRKMVVILWTFVIVVMALLILSYQIIGSLSALRAYVGGEGLWSKAQKQAVHNLTKYASSHSEEDYQAYLQAVRTPLGDKKARLELEKSFPNSNVIREGFVQGRNSPEDVKGMTDLFRRFRHTRYMEEAIAIWEEGDILIDELEVLGDELHKEIASGSPNSARVTEITHQIDLVGDRLSPLEDRFSYSLGSGARWAAGWFSLVIVGATMSSAALGTLFTVLILRHLQKTEEWYKHFLDTANDAILVWDAETGTILEANKRSAALLGSSVSAIMDMRWHEFFDESDQEDYQHILDAAVRGANVEGKELRVRHANGAMIAVEVNTSLTEIEGKKIIQGIFRDIRERKRLEEEIRQAHKMEVVGSLAGGIAHDFNNLLMVILTHLAKMRRNLDRAQTLECSEVIQMAAEKAATLTKQLLAFGRKQVLELEVVNLNSLLDDARPILATIPANGIQLEVTSVVQPLPVRIDAGKIEQVIMNLAVNACDAMPEGGTLKIQTARVDKRKVPSSTRKELCPYALLEVSDTGDGIDEETQSHIFEPFFTTKPPGKGTGLGLSTVYGIVKQSGGTIEVESEVNIGSTFRVYLPIVDEPVRARLMPRSAHMAMQGTETVLLAEDQPSISRRSER